MKFNKKAVQHTLDIAADALEKAGHTDLADRVDYYNNRLVTASEKEIPLIKRALFRVHLEAKRRMGLKAKVAKKEEKKETKSASDLRRKAFVMARIRKVVATKKAVAKKIEKLKVDRISRLQERRTAKKKVGYSRKKSQKGGIEIELSNQHGEMLDGIALINSVSSDGAHQIRENDPETFGSSWEFEGNDFAYSFITDSPTLVKDLENAGYIIVKDHDYYPWGSMDELTESLSDEYKQFL